MDIIKKKVDELNIPDNGTYWYFYILPLDGRACAKCGSSADNLSKRINNYLFSEREHLYQDKIMDEFELLLVVEIKRKNSLKSFERFVKYYLEDCPLHDDQDVRTEQFDLEKVWNSEFKDFVKGDAFPFSKKFYRCENIDDKIKKLINFCSKLEKTHPRRPYKNTVDDDKLCIERKHNIIRPKNVDDMLLEYLNNMSICELQMVSGIGPILSKRIFAHMPFSSFNSLLNLYQIGPSRFNSVKSYIKSRALDFMLNRIGNEDHRIASIN